MNQEQFDPEAILETYGNMVYKIALSHLRNTYDTDDVYQEVFLRLVRYQPIAESEEHRKAWLIRITINLCNDHFRKVKRQNTVELSDQLPAKQTCSSELSLFDYVAKLPEKYRTVLHLFYYEDLSVEQIAEILQSKLSTVRSWLRRGRGELKTMLEKEAPAHEWTI